MIYRALQIAVSGHPPPPSPSMTDRLLAVGPALPVTSRRYKKPTTGVRVEHIGCLSPKVARERKPKKKRLRLYFEKASLVNPTFHQFVLITNAQISQRLLLQTRAELSKITNGSITWNSHCLTHPSGCALIGVTQTHPRPPEALQPTDSDHPTMGLNPTRPLCSY